MTSSFHVKAGQSLGILQGGVAAPLDISEGSLSGSGTLLNPIVVSTGGGLSPGESPGTLTFADSLALGPGSFYDWETADPMGTAGSGWDLIQVAKELTFTATDSEKFLVRVIGLDAIPLAAFPNPDLQQPQRWLIAAAGSISGFDPAAVAFEVVPSPGAKRILLPQHFSLSTEGGDLYLTFQVPEPASISLMILLGIWQVIRERNRAVSTRQITFENLAANCLPGIASGNACCAGVRHQVGKLRVVMRALEVLTR
jgi:hypothetical protein